MRTKAMAAVIAAQAALIGADTWPNIPGRYLEQVKSIPKFWVTAVDEVADFLDTHIRNGQVRQFGKTAGGRAMSGVSGDAGRRAAVARNAIRAVITDRATIPMATTVARTTRPAAEVSTTRTPSRSPLGCPACGCCPARGWLGITCLAI